MEIYILNNLFLLSPTTRVVNLFPPLNYFAGYASTNETTFKKELSQYWFYKFSRSGGPLDSCGFEHVFLGQLKATTVSGFHNWVQFYTQEKEGDLDYKTYLEGCQVGSPGTSLSYKTFLLAGGVCMYVLHQGRNFIYFLHIVLGKT